MTYISENEAQKYILPIIDLFKQSKYDEVINLIQKENIDPKHSDHIICDYAALWLDEPHLVPFFKKIKAIGGNPIGHNSMLKNIAQLGKADSLKYLIQEGVLDIFKDEAVYAVNTAIMGGQVKTFKILAQELDITNFVLHGEKNPSFVNRLIPYPNKDIMNYVFKNNLIQPFIFTKETIDLLERASNKRDGLSPDDNEKNEILEGINFFITKVAANFGLKNKKDYVSQDGYEPGDITAIFGKIQYDALSKQLKEKPAIQTKTRKI